MTNSADAPFRAATCTMCRGTRLESLTAYGSDFRQCTECTFIQRVEVVQANVEGQGFTAGVNSGEREIFLAKVLKNHFGLDGRLLLYGTGNSPALRTLRKSGFNARGCDLSSDVVESGKREFGEDVFLHYDELPNRGMRFDGIVAVEVIEHFHDPASEATRLASVMSDRGIFCGTTNFVFNQQIAGDPTDYFKLKSHVALFTDRSFARFAKEQNRMAATFKLINPGTGFPGVFKPLFPSKRVFFSYPERHEPAFAPLREFSHFPITAA